MSHMPPTPRVVPPGSITMIRNVRDYGAAGDGVTDDTTAIRRALEAAASGGTIYFPPGTYKTTQTIVFDKSDITLTGTDAEIYFHPSAPYVGGTNDRCFYIHLGDDVGNDADDDYTAERNIVGAIDVGDTSFTLASAGDGADLVAGTWLTVSEIDTGVEPDEIVFFDWVQVASVVGTTVNVYAPFRTAFPATHNTVKFRKITNLVRNVVVRDLRFRTTNADRSLPHIVIGMVREVTISNVTFTSARGNGIATYRTADLIIENCHQRANFEQATEIASTVGLSIKDCTWATYDISSTGSQLVLDYGTAFFHVSGCRIGPSGNIACMIIYGCHDGVFEANYIDYVRDAGVTNTIGLLVQGCERVIIAYNVLRGGDGVAAEGITVAATTGFSPDLSSVDNVIIDNVVTNFANAYGAAVATDLYRKIVNVTTDISGPLRLRSTLTADNNATIGNSTARSHTVNGKLTINVAAAGQCLVIQGETNGQSDAQAKLVSNKTGWGNITGQLKTTAGGSSSTDKLEISIDSGYIALKPGGGTDALVVMHNGDVRLGGTGGPLLRSGAGSPEGAVTAPVGSLYLRTDGGAGSSLYVKQSDGTGNTGWAGK